MYVGAASEHSIVTTVVTFVVDVIDDDVAIVVVIVLVVVVPVGIIGKTFSLAFASDIVLVAK